MSPGTRAFTAAILQELRPRGPHTRSKKNKGKRPQQGGS